MQQTVTLFFRSSQNVPFWETSKFFRGSSSALLELLFKPGFVWVMFCCCRALILFFTSTQHSQVVNGVMLNLTLGNFFSWLDSCARMFMSCLLTELLKKQTTRNPHKLQEAAKIIQTLNYCLILNLAHFLTVSKKLKAKQKILGLIKHYRSNRDFLKSLFILALT